MSIVRALCERISRRRIKLIKRLFVIPKHSLSSSESSQLLMSLSIADMTLIRSIPMVSTSLEHSFSMPIALSFRDTCNHILNEQMHVLISDEFCTTYRIPEWYKLPENDYA